MKWILLSAIVATAVIITACSGPNNADTRRIDRVYNGQVYTVAEKDGVTLYRVFDKDAQQIVYFSAGGTTRQQNCGKACVRRVEVPAAP